MRELLTYTKGQPPRKLTRAQVMFIVVKTMNILERDYDADLTSLGTPTVNEITDRIWKGGKANTP